MKFRKILLLFMILAFGLVVEGIRVTRSVLDDGTLDGLSLLDGDFPFSRLARFRGPSHEFKEQKTTESAGVTAIEVSNAFGDVTVRRTLDAKATAITVNLTKEVFTRRDENASEIGSRVVLNLDRSGSVVKISAPRSGRTERVRTHIEIETPLPLDTRVVNRHGKITVEGARALDASGEFDDVTASDISGDCLAKNRHGNVEVVSAALGCRVDVDFGDAHIERLGGPSTAEVAHGSLNAIDLAGLTARLRFSDLMARKIAGDLQFEGEHSDVRIEEVKGNVTLKNQGDIDIQNVQGRVSVENERGHVRVMKVQDGATIRNTFDTVAASDVSGVLEVINRHGEIRAQRFSKGARLETDSEDVEVSDFEGPLTVVAKRGNVAVKPVRRSLSPMDVQVDVGDIHLGLADSINASLDAEIETRGDITANVGALRSLAEGKRSLKATVGAGGALLKLRSRLGDIQLDSDSEVEVAEPEMPDAPEIDTRARGIGAAPLPATPKTPDMPGLPKAPPAPAQPKLPKAAQPAAPQPPAPPAAPSKSPSDH